ncbi:MAG: hypothetical protein AUJ92_10210 [Armatimonadetes bacterium CG2_30_59_28]|nr:MAG: hypothetical protein AUJ92_10210 [Armatimonadetes bacterium CG2_30_59_28]
MINIQLVLTSEAKIKFLRSISITFRVLKVGKFMSTGCITLTTTSLVTNTNMIGSGTSYIYRREIQCKSDLVPTVRLSLFLGRMFQRMGTIRSLGLKQDLTR